MRRARGSVRLAGAMTAALGVTGAHTGDLPSPVLQEAFRQALGPTALQEAEWSALAVSLDRGDTLFHLRPARVLAPASNMKLFTTAAALQVLGPSFRFRTYLLSTAAPQRGIIDGDLVLYGTGDPALSDRFQSGGDPLERLADAVRDQGILWIRGDVVADGSFLTGAPRPEGWPEDDLDEWYAAPVGGLSYNENVLTLRTAPPDQVGQPPRVDLLPRVGEEPVENRARTRPGSGRPMLAVTRPDPMGPIQIMGSIAMNQRPIWKRVPVSDPVRFAGHALKNLLEERGIRVEGEVVPVQDPGESPLGAPGIVGLGETGLHTLATHESPPLDEYLAVVNRESDNFFAESLFRAMGRLGEGVGSYQGGQVATRKFLESFPGIPADQVEQKDGSGLSPENRASAAALVRLLAWVAESPMGEDFAATLPVAGERRGLPRMFGTPAAGNLRAKTGTIDRVSALSGYVGTRSGERVVFSIVSNGIRSRGRAKALEDKVGTLLAGWSRGTGADANGALRTRARLQP